MPADAGRVEVAGEQFAPQVCLLNVRSSPKSTEGSGVREGDYRAGCIDEEEDQVKMKIAVLQCTTCGHQSECYVTNATVGDVFSTGECDQCAYDQPNAGRKAKVVSVR